MWSGAWSNGARKGPKNDRSKALFGACCLLFWRAFTASFFGGKFSGSILNLKNKEKRIKEKFKQLILQQFFNDYVKNKDLDLIFVGPTFFQIDRHGSRFLRSGFRVRGPILEF